MLRWSIAGAACTALKALVQTDGHGIQLLKLLLLLLDFVSHHMLVDVFTITLVCIKHCMKCSMIVAISENYFSKPDYPLIAISCDDN